MKITEVIVESKLEEGPILNKVGSAIGKGVGTLAKGIGAVAGGVAGLGSAVKKGFQAGKKTVAGAGDDDEDTASATGAAKPSTSAAPAAAGGIAAKPSASDNKLSNPTPPTGSAKSAASGTPPAGSDTAAPQTNEPNDMIKGFKQAAGIKDPNSDAQQAQAAAGKSGQSAANDTEYAKVQKAVDGLDPEQRKELIAALQADPKVKAVMTKSAAKKPAATSGTMKGAPGKPSFSGVPDKTANTATKSPAAKPATTTTSTVKQKSLTPAGFGQMVGGLTKKAG